MANPGDKNFNPTDNGGGTRVRLYFAAKSGDYWIVSYEHGGRGYHTDCFFVKTKRHKTVIAYEMDDSPGMKMETFTTIEELKTYSSKQKLKLKMWYGGPY